jgi:hypothetical protein
MNIKTLVIALAAGVSAATSSFADRPNGPEASAVEKAYQAGFGNAALYWSFSHGVTITDPKDIKETAETRAYRQGYTKGTEREASIKGWVKETMEMLHTKQ